LGAKLKAIAERAQYITAASGAAIALKEGKEFVCRAATGSTAPDLGAYLEVKTGLTAECIRTGYILRCDNAELDPRVDLESCRRLGIESIVVMPILRQDVLAGIFELFGSQAYCFQERDVEALKGLAKSVAALLSEPDIGSPNANQPKAVIEPEKPSVEQPARASAAEKHDVVCSSCGGVIDRGTGICALCAPSFPGKNDSDQIQSTSHNWSGRFTVARILVPGFFVGLAVLVAVAPIHPSPAALPPEVLAQGSRQYSQPVAQTSKANAGPVAKPLVVTGQPSAPANASVPVQDVGMTASVKQLLGGVSSDFSRLLPTSQVEEEEFEVTDEGNPNIRVWVDTRKGYYYCPSDPLYGRTARGTYMSQQDAEADYYIPALMKPCP